MVLGKAAGSCSIFFSPVIFFSFLSGLDPTRDKRTSKNPHDREDRQLGLVPGAHGPRNIAGSSDILIPALLGCGVAARDGAGLVPVAICGSRARGVAGHVSGHGGGELAALADLVAVQVEDDWDGDEGCDPSCAASASSDLGRGRSARGGASPPKISSTRTTMGRTR